VFEEVNVTTRLVSVLHAASRSVAVNCPTAPGVRFRVAGAMVTLATGGGITVTCVDPSWPSLVATMVTGPPTETALTIPVAETVATPGLVDDQFTWRFDNAFPCASFGVAVNCVVCPSEMVADGGVTCTEATGSGGDVPPPLQAAINVRHAERQRRATRPAWRRELPIVSDVETGSASVLDAFIRHPGMFQGMRARGVSV
jgi:hypothetical protein